MNSSPDAQLQAPKFAVSISAVSDDQKPFHPYDFQLQAADALSRHFLQQGTRAGILKVPTGGGKTAIASRWLLQNHVAKGGRVLWLAHRSFLLEQAKREFVRHRALARSASSATPKTELSGVTVAGDKASWSSVAASDDLVFATMQSTCREDSMGYLDLLVQQSKAGLFVVVDEAHHAAAQGYVRVLTRLRHYDCPLLGLTATPLRMVEKDEVRMWRLFDNKLLFELTPSELFEKGILARPKIETVPTHVELQLTPEQLADVAKKGDLASKLLEKLGKHAARNKLIVQHYLAKQDQYRETIVFAVDVDHAKTLAEEFQKHGVSADYATYDSGNASEVLDRFANQKGLKVLCNVEMSTEGFDAPHTQTVFLARPSQSQSLLWQMIGRALRGTRAGGTEDAWLVTFVDTFKNFSPLDVETLIRGSELGELLEPERAAGRLPAPLQPVSHALLQELYQLLISNTKGEFLGVHECIPSDWVSWEEEFEDDVQTRQVMIWDNQKLGYKLFRSEHLEESSAPLEEPIDEVLVRQLIGLFFADCPDPLPRWQDLAALLRAKQKGCQLHWYSFPERDAIDPRHFARRFFDEDTGERTQLTILREFWDSNALVRFIYRNVFENYLEEVKLYKAVEAEKQACPPPSPKLLSLVPSQPLERYPEGQGYNLLSLRDAVFSIPSHFPHGAPPICDLAYLPEGGSRGCWAFYRNDVRAIRVRPVLNSPSVPRFVMESLLYHELLHADMPNDYHSKQYRVRERRFVPTQAAIDDALARGFELPTEQAGWRNLANQFLDTLHERYKLW
ncbi:MAG: DEAD/DEAH box helicase [Myxococcota bacterium]|nr:DEAD/DEAH box helicase [Myxococcota bacterium]